MAKAKAKARAKAKSGARGKPKSGTKGKTKAGTRKKSGPQVVSNGPGSGWFRTLLRGLVTIGLVLLISYVTMVLFVRTDGFRSYLEGRLEKHLGLVLDIGTSRLGWTGDLTLGELAPAGGTESSGGRLQVEEVVVKTDLFRLWQQDLAATLSHLTVTGLELTFHQNVEGDWEPVVLAGMNQWLSRWCKIDVVETESASEEKGGPQTDDEKAPDFSSFDLKSMRLAVQDATIIWEDAEGQPLASAHDLEAFVTPLNLPTRQATHIHVRSSSVTLSPWQKIQDLDVELLRSDDNYRVLRLNAERRSVRRESPAKNTAAEVTRQGETVVEDVTPAPPKPVVQALPLPTPRASVSPPGSPLESQIRAELKEALGE